ncbi:hypothetical protein [Anaerotignum sp.]|uniref:hypothetical protein n=1 Tax=Anaerotignum sp. TaxID=2039241 RepID=UPI003736B1CD
MLKNQHFWMQWAAKQKDDWGFCAKSLKIVCFARKEHKGQIKKENKYEKAFCS